MTVGDSIALVIGASSGMGRATAVQFAREGAKVVAVARRRDRLEELQAQAGVGFEVADATDPDAMQRVADRTIQRFGRIDILVYATGTNTPDRALTRLTPEVWNHLINVNLNGAYYATRAVLPVMRAHKEGLIFYISSRSATAADESGAAYQASKRGMHGLAHAVRLEERDNGIRTCLVAPALTDTEILEHRLVKPSAETLAKALQPEDIAETILYIAKMPARTWVPEVHLACLMLGHIDHLGLSDQQYLDWAYQRNRELLQQPLFKLLMLVVSPAMLLRGAGSRFESFHLGTSVSALPKSEREWTLMMTFRPHLFPSLVLRGYTMAFVAAMELTGAKQVRCELVTSQPDSGVFRVGWQA